MVGLGLDWVRFSFSLKQGLGSFFRMTQFWTRGWLQSNELKDASCWLKVKGYIVVGKWMSLGLAGVLRLVGDTTARRGKLGTATRCSLPF